MIVGGEKPSLEELAHFGVKGMKWGTKKSDQPTNANYTSQMRNNDKSAHGARAVKRINKRLNEGETRDKALHREDVRNARQKLAVAGGLFVASLLIEHGSLPVHNLKSYVGNRANQNRAASRVRDSTLAIGSDAAKLAYAKSRRGVHNITTLK